SRPPHGAGCRVARLADPGDALAVCRCFLSAINSSALDAMDRSGSAAFLRLRRHTHDHRWTPCSPVRSPDGHVPRALVSGPVLLVLLARVPPRRPNRTHRPLQCRNPELSYGVSVDG